jgi:hypothetical protein
MRFGEREMISEFCEAVLEVETESAKRKADG